MEEMAMYDREFGVDLSDLPETDGDGALQADQPEADAAENKGGTEDHGAAGEADTARRAQEEDTEDEAAPEEDTEDEAAPEEDTEDEAAPEASGKGGTDTYELHCLGRTLTVDRENVIRYAQKGMDYDRVKQQRDEALSGGKEGVEAAAWRREHEQAVRLVEAMAQRAGLSVTALRDKLRAEELTAEGMSREAAKERVARENAERALAEKDTGRASTQEAQRKEQIRREVAAFQQAHAEVDLKALLPELDDDLKQAGNLEGAFLRHENRRLTQALQTAQETLAAERQNRSNRTRTSGSQSADSGETEPDPFLKYFLQDDI